MRNIVLFCDKVTRLFTSEMSMSAADFKQNLSLYLQKQVCAMMEMQEAFNLYVIPGKSHVLSRGNNTLQNGSSFCPNSAMDFAGIRSNCVSPLSSLCACTWHRSGYIDADVGLSSD